MSIQDEIKQLKESLASVEKDFIAKIETIKKQITVLETKIAQEATGKKSEQISKSETAPSKTAAKKAETVIKQAVQSAPIRKQRKITFAAIITVLVAIPLIRPLSGILEKLLDLYSHYKKQGKLPILFLTLAGIVALVAGIGYILQYSFVNYFSESAKIISGIIVAAGIILLGIKTIHKEDSYREFGSSLVALGIIITYLCIYFASSYYKLVPQYVGFIAICLNTIIAYALALRYETRVVAVIYFFGGTLAPFYLANPGALTEFYFYFLIVLCLSTIPLSYKIKWPVLVHISFLTAAGIIEAAVISSHKSMALLSSVALFHGYFYIYMYYGLFDGLKKKSELKKNDLLIIAGSLTLFLVNCLMLIKSEQLLGTVYLANALPVTLLFIMTPLKQNRQVKLATMIVAGILVGAAIPAFFTLAIMPLFWMQEALLLLTMGFIMNMAAVRREGYILCLLAMVFALVNSNSIVDNWRQTLWHEGMLNLVAFGALFIVVDRLMAKYNDLFAAGERAVHFIIKETISLWGLAVFMLVTLFYLPDYALSLMAVAMIVLFYRSYKSKLILTQALGVLCYLLLIVQIGINAVNAGTLQFSKQTTYGKIVIAEAFGLLWFMQLLYERIMPGSSWTAIMKKVRILFYLLLPLVFIPHVHRHYPAFTIIALWGSVLICLALYEIIRAKALRLELLILASIVSTLTCTFGYFSEAYVYNYAALAIGALFYAGVLLWKKGLGDENIRDRNYDFVFNLAFIYGGFALMAAGYALFQSATVVWYIAGIYALCVVLIRKKIWPVATYLAAYYRTGQFALLLAVIMHIDSYAGTGHAAYLLIPLLLSVGLFGCLVFIDKQLHNEFSKGKEFLYKTCMSIDMYLFHLLTMFGYLFLLYLITGLWWGPFATVLLVVHATSILFISTMYQLKSLAPFYIGFYAITLIKIFFYDLKDFSLFQKIIAFTIIGIIMLASAYGMHRFISARKKS